MQAEIVSQDGETAFRRKSAVAWVVVILAAGLVPAAAGEEPSEWTDRQMEEFLLRAEITTLETLDIGVTRSQKAVLSLGEVTHDAHVQTVDISKKKAKLGNRTVFDFRDSYRYNIAGYHLDRILGLDMVPVSVARTVRGKRAAVTWWVDDVLMMEMERVAGNIQPPEPGRWVRQNHRVMVFSELIYNTDLNLGNLLITRDWKIWMIDFSRAFRRFKRLANPNRLKAIDSRLLDRLRGLTRQELDAGLESSLTKGERAALLARRDRIVRFFEERASQPGGAGVIYDLAVDGAAP